MKKIKLFKAAISLIASTLIVGSVSVTAISCGHHNPTWGSFKAKALAETAKNLKNSVADLNSYNWNSGDIAVFQTNNKPKQVNDTHKISAIIVIEGRNADLAYPIYFNITYQNKAYDIKYWTNAQLKDWTEFKIAALSVSPRELLNEAKALKTNWNKYRWIGNSAWQNSDVPEFDVYGGNGGSDTYKGMNGSLIADENAKTINGIISIKGHEGVWNADPIKASISFHADAYNIKNWTFDQEVQLQSKTKYLALTQQVIDLAIGMNGDNAKWALFSDGNWVDNKHTTTLDVYLEKGGWPGISSHTHRYIATGSSPGTENPEGSGLVSVIKIRFTDNAHPYLAYNSTLTCDFEYIAGSNKNVGNCFSYSWHVSKPV